MRDERAIQAESAAVALLPTALEAVYTRDFANDSAYDLVYDLLPMVSCK
jgi:hypothetical protein